MNEKDGEIPLGEELCCRLCYFTNGILDYKVGAAIEGQNMMISNFSKSYYAGSRMNLVIYDSDGKQRKKPLESVILMGKAEEAPVKSSDAAPAPPATPSE